MKRRRLYLIYIVFPVWVAAGGLLSCSRSASVRQEAVDSLNTLAYRFRYKNLDSCAAYAERAYAVGEDYANGRGEALNHLAFHAFMKMDFARSRRYASEVYRQCNSEIERFIADVCLMKVCQRTSANKEFYDHRNNALRRIRRIDEERSLLRPHEQERLAYALSEFHITSSIYHYYLQQEEQALEEINRIDPAADVPGDTAQWLYHRYMKGSGGLCEGADAGEVAVREFDYLCSGLAVAHTGGYLYFEADFLQALAELLSDNRSMQAVQLRRPGGLRLLNPDGEADTLFVYSLAEEALRKFRTYGDDYQIAGVCRTLATCLIRRGAYEAAIDSLGKALDYVNDFHAKYLSRPDTLPPLLPYRPGEEVSLEKQWLDSGDVPTVPEWIARIREQLSLAYAGMGRKAESDYNRNIYLDILDVTRQDKELESRYDLLARETKQLNGWLYGLMALIGVGGLLSWQLNRAWKRNYAEQVKNLQQILELCRRITASLSPGAADMEEIARRIREAVQEGMKTLFGPCDVEVDCEAKQLRIHTSAKLGREKRAVLELLSPYVAWTIENGRTFVLLGDERKALEKERYLSERRMAENKRQNTVKKACLALVTGITPFLDRILYEVRALRHAPDCTAARREQYRYIGSLADKINEYNDMLALWIKMRQGTWNLHIENFALGELFDIVSRGRKAFESKRQQFAVEPTQAVVKADKALTLFMINTLTENGRKYTPEGGSIRVKAEETETYVEISVTDTGIGLSEADRECILGEKVYDSGRIGMQDEASREMLGRNKGSGFGLINCKGIIEKYRKTDALFRVCRFDVESVPGQGSRFFFRLPKGVLRAFLLLLLLLPVGVSARERLPYYDENLEQAASFADSVYYSNVGGRYAEAIRYVDSAIVYLNRHYRIHAAGLPDRLMSRAGEGEAAEIAWWRQRFDTDYHVILDIRNEAAVASLALRDWEGYRYHNNAYTRLYKLLGEDTSLEGYCREMQRSADNKEVGILLCLLLAIALAAGHYLFYFRRRILYRLNLEQVLEIDRQVIASSMSPAEEEGISSIPQRILRDTFGGLNDLLDIRAAGMAVRSGKTVHYAVFPEHTEEEELLRSRMRQCCETPHFCHSEKEAVQCFPLWVTAGGTRQYLGVLAVWRNRTGHREEETLLAELIARYVSIIVMNVVVRRGDQYRDIEQAQDEKARAEYEENRLHVQNQVLDNCLSTIKHETLYYPNRIRQLAEQLMQGLPETEELRSVVDMEELAACYKDLFTLLCTYAARQLEEITFRRSVVQVESLWTVAQRCVARCSRRRAWPLALEAKPTGLSVTGDRVLLEYLMENLVEAAARSEEEGTLCLSAREEGNFVCVELTDSRGRYDREETNLLFQPDRRRMQPGGEKDELRGTEYLVCKQIVRDHDELAGQRGCRIEAEPLPQGGLMIRFSLPCGDLANNNT